MFSLMMHFLDLNYIHILLVLKFFREAVLKKFGAVHGQKVRMPETNKYNNSNISMNLL